MRVGEAPTPPHAAAVRPSRARPPIRPPSCNAMKRPLVLHPSAVRPRLDAGRLGPQPWPYPDPADPACLSPLRLPPPPIPGRFIPPSPQLSPDEFGPLTSWLHELLPPPQTPGPAALGSAESLAAEIRVDDVGRFLLERLRVDAEVWEDVRPPSPVVPLPSPAKPRPDGRRALSCAGF